MNIIQVWCYGCLTLIKSLRGTRSPGRSWSRPEGRGRPHWSPSENRTPSQTCPPAPGGTTPESSACSQYSVAHSPYLKQWSKRIDFDVLVARIKFLEDLHVITVLIFSNYKYSVYQWSLLIYIYQWSVLP